MQVVIKVFVFDVFNRLPIFQVTARRFV